MDEYIEREAAIDAVTEVYYNTPDVNLSGEKFEAAINGILATDVAPVVRCKDCKHFKHYGKTSLLIDGEHIRAGLCYRRARYNEEYRMPPDGFCSYVERKDDADG